MKRFPDIFKSYYDDCKNVGFRSVEDNVSGGWSTKNDESGVADLAGKLNTEIIFKSYIRHYIK